MSGPAYRIHACRLVVRCWNPEDAPRFKSAIDASLDHLRPWMPWAHGEPTDLEAKISLLRRWRSEFDLDQDFFYGIFDREESRVIGGTGLHTRAGAQARMIGYWIHVDHIGRGYATEVSAALTRVAFEIDRVERVEIHVAAGNARSAAVPRKLGYELEATLRRREFSADGPPRDMQYWALHADTYPGSPSAKADIEAFDAAGRRLL